MNSRESPLLYRNNDWVFVTDCVSCRCKTRIARKEFVFRKLIYINECDNPKLQCYCKIIKNYDSVIHISSYDATKLICTINIFEIKNVR